MGAMIIVVKDSGSSRSDYSPSDRTIRLDCQQPRQALAMTLVHELGHALDPTLKAENALAYFRPNDHSVVGEEVKAWRIAKTICPPALWDEGVALRAIKSYLAPDDMWKYWRRQFCNERIGQYRRLVKIGIIPLDKCCPRAYYVAVSQHPPEGERAEVRYEQPRHSSFP